MTVENVGGDLDRHPADDADSVGLALGAMSRADMPVQMRLLLVRSLGYLGGHLHSVGLQAEDTMPTSGHGAKRLRVRRGRDAWGRSGGAAAAA